MDVTHDGPDGSGQFRHVDPNMAKEEHLLAQMNTDLRHKSQRHEDFYREMQAAGHGEGVVGGFDKVAEYFGHGVFNHSSAKKKTLSSRRSETPRSAKDSPRYHNT